MPVCPECSKNHTILSDVVRIYDAESMTNTTYQEQRCVCGFQFEDKPYVPIFTGWTGRNMNKKTTGKGSISMVNADDKFIRDPDTQAVMKLMDDGWVYRGIAEELSLPVAKITYMGRKIIRILPEKEESRTRIKEAGDIGYLRDPDTKEIVLGQSDKHKRVSKELKDKLKNESSGLKTDITIQKKGPKIGTKYIRHIDPLYRKPGTVSLDTNGASEFAEDRLSTQIEKRLSKMQLDEYGNEIKRKGGRPPNDPEKGAQRPRYKFDIDGNVIKGHIGRPKINRSPEEQEAWNKHRAQQRATYRLEAKEKRKIAAELRNEIKSKPESFWTQQQDHHEEIEKLRSRITGELERDTLEKEEKVG